MIDDIKHKKNPLQSLQLSNVYQGSGADGTETLVSMYGECKWNQIWILCKEKYLKFSLEKNMLTIKGKEQKGKEIFENTRLI